MLGDISNLRSAWATRPCFFNLKFKNLMKFFKEKEKPVPALMGISYQLCALNIRLSFLVFASEKVTL